MKCRVRSTRYGSKVGMSVKWSAQFMRHVIGQLRLIKTNKVTLKSDFTGKRCRRCVNTLANTQRLR